jgi:hypothetical protein
MPALLRTVARTLDQSGSPSPIEEVALADRIGKLEDQLAGCDSQDAKLIGAALTELARELRERPSPPVERALVSLELALGNCTSSPRKRAQAVSAEQVTAWTAARSKLRAGPLLGQSMYVSAVDLHLNFTLESAKATTWVALHDELPKDEYGRDLYSADIVLRALRQHELLTLGLWLTGNEGGVSLLSKADARELSILVHTYPDRARTLAAFAARP